MSEQSNSDPSELISVCDAILEDGELSGDELYDLAEWLNSHREACLLWPGDLLVQPLQEIWADGKVNKTELRLFSRLLLRIRKEWAKIQSLEATNRIKGDIAAIAENFDLRYAQLPSIPLQLTVKSHSVKGVTYQVDLSEPSCTCPDWVGGRGRGPVGSLVRCCKHVLHAFRRVEPENGWPGWLGAFVSFGWPPHPNQTWNVIKAGSSFVLLSSATNGWANVYLEVDGSCDRFGYNVVERRWSYGVAPPGSRTIVRAIPAW